MRRDPLSVSARRWRWRLAGLVAVLALVASSVFAQRRFGEATRWATAGDFDGAGYDAAYPQRLQETLY